MSQTYIQSVVILIVSILSLLGAGWIILSFACFSSLRSFRHQLILGLAISDFVMAINFLSSTSMNINGHYIGAPEQKMFCSFNGFMTQVFVIQTDYWVLLIAICTYFILADHRQLSSWVQDHRILLLPLPWVLSITWAGIGLGITGYGDIGTWCWFTSDKVRLLVNFVPRWLIIAAMLIMYARLYFLLYRAHNRFVSIGHSSSNDGTSGSRTLDAVAQTASQPRMPASNSFTTPSSRRGAAETNKKLKRLARLMLMYPVGYMLVWALPTAIRIYQAAKGVPSPFALQVMDDACIVLQGFVDAVIYGVNESSLNSWRNLFFPVDFPTIEVIDGAGRRDEPKRRTRHGVPSSRLEHNVVSSDSSSTFEMIISATDSRTHITDVSPTGESQRVVSKDSIIELRTLPRAKIHTTFSEGV